MFGYFIFSGFGSGEPNGKAKPVKGSLNHVICFFCAERAKKKYFLLKVV
jgi:hypothetical protein